MLGHHIVGLNLLDFLSLVPALVDLPLLPTVGVPLLLLLLHLLHPLPLVVHHEGVDSEHLVEYLLLL